MGPRTQLRLANTPITLAEVRVAYFHQTDLRVSAACPP